MKSSFCIDLQRFMLIPTKFPLNPTRFYFFIILLFYINDNTNHQTNKKTPAITSRS